MLIWIKDNSNTGGVRVIAIQINEFLLLHISPNFYTSICRRNKIAQSYINFADKLVRANISNSLSNYRCIPCFESPISIPTPSFVPWRRSTLQKGLPLILWWLISVGWKNFHPFTLQSFLSPFCGVTTCSPPPNIAKYGKNIFRRHPFIDRSKFIPMLALPHKIMSADYKKLNPVRRDVGGAGRVLGWRNQYDSSARRGTPESTDNSSNVRRCDYRLGLT